ncbi:MAG: LysE family transporter [Bifidobacterium sp.]|jgi:L-lysine exporter family protein LysE/ArgO|nr:LysE family transporter [Bifidobacterium sp.]MCH4175824.1 LysE family transporter [Bifidobacterium sp.]
MNSIFLPILLSGFLSQAGLIVAVGAQNTFIIRQGIARSHVPQILAICIAADLLMITLGTQGMGQVVQSHPLVIKGLTWAGAAVLLLYGIFGFRRAWIQFRAMRMQRHISEEGQNQRSDNSNGANLGTTPSEIAPPAMVKPAQTSLKKSILSCLGFTFLNPSVYLDSIVLLGSIAATYGTDMRWSFATGAMLCSVVWFLLLGFVSSKMARLFNNRIAWIALDTTIGIVMVLLAAHLVLQ